MSGRRTNGEGTIYWNASRKRYEGQVTVHDPRTGRKTRKKRTGPTKAHVRQQLEEASDRASRGSVLPESTTVAEWLEHWIAEVLPGESIKDKTRSCYTFHARHFLTPAIGRIRLSELQPADVRVMLSRLTKDGLKANTVRLTRATLCKALKVALIDGHVTRNVASLTSGPRKDSTPRRAMTREQVSALLDAAAGERVEPLIHVLLATGVRISEALGLSWRDIDLAANPPTISVVYALTTVDGRLTLDSPKTARSRRRIFVPPQTAEVLRILKRHQNRERLAAGPSWGEGWDNYDFVFTTPIGTPLDHSNLRGQINRILKAAGIDHWTIHELRHTAASLMIAAGVPLKEVSEAMGHSSIAMTADVYGHLLEPSRATSKVMEKVMYG